MSVKAIARMAGKGLTLDFISGGAPALSMDQLMACLKGLDRGPELLIRAAFIGQPVMRDLYLEGFHLAVTIASEKGWKPVKGKPVLRNMAAMAIDEVVAPNRHFCPACGGTGQTYGGPDKPPGVCRRCTGSGNRFISMRSQAARCDIDEAAWRRTWAPRYPVIRMAIYGWQDDGLRHVKNRLQREYADA